MPMPKEFADWYRSASIDPPQELLEQRWGRVEETAKGLSADTLLATLKVFSIRQEPGFKAPDFLDEAFRKGDDSFSTRNLAELRVLAGAILREAININAELAVPAALGLVTSCFGRRSDLPNVDHVDAAERFLSERAENARKIVSPPQAASIEMSKERFDVVVPAATFNPNQTPQARDPLFNALNEQAAKASQEITKASAALWRIIKTQREELNLLWWLQTKYSRHLKKLFRDFTTDEAALVLASEVAELTEFIPGPSAILGVLLAALDCAADQRTEITIQKAVASTPRDWRKVRADKESASGVGELCPVLLAIVKSLETTGESDWVPVYQRYCDVKIGEATKSIDIAYQLYQELLFSRAIRGLK